MNTDYEEKICYYIQKIKRLNGAEYPSNTAEKKSLIYWLYVDVCLRMIDVDEVEKIASKIIGE
jgi:hypothetical protein